MTGVLVVGGGDQGRQVISAIEAAGPRPIAGSVPERVLGVLDGRLPRGTLVAGYPVFGTEDDLRACGEQQGADAFVVAIGDNSTRAALLERLTKASPDLSVFTVVHPTAMVARDATIGGGSIILAAAVVSNGCTVGRGVLLGTHSSVDHDCTIDDYASLAPGVTTGGTVHIGRATAIGVGANVVHGITIGADTVIGAGALVLDAVPERVVAFGVPARVVRERAPDEPYL
jgi:sugar O-acyltransferase (sialic acid O-acetyltransferase NeuD family)